MLRIIKDFRAVEQRLGGDAALVEADASQAVFLEKNDGESGCAGAFRGDITAGTASDDG